MWAARRRFLYLSTLLFFIAIGAFYVYRTYFYQEPTCFDNTLNQNEEDIDCGGVCDKVCTFRATSPNILWSRALEVAPGIYNLIAKVENPNFDFRMRGTYVFKAYSPDNVLVEEIINDIELDPSQVKLVLEPGVNVGEKKIGRVFFELLENRDWDVHEPTQTSIKVVSRVLEDKETSPKLKVVLENKSLTPVRDVNVLVAIYNKNEVVIQTSSSYEEYFDRDQIVEKVFTWQKPFGDEAARIEVFIEENVFD